MRTLFFCLAMSLTGCGNESGKRPSPDPVPELVLTASGSPVVLGNTNLTFSATGGTGSYVYSVDSGGGTIDANTGVYTAPSSPENVVVTATDSAGSTIGSTITVLGTPGLWLRADSGVTSSEGAVSQWADQSGNGNDFTQSNAAMQPTLTTYNSYAALSFNGITNGLANSANSGLDLAGDSSVFMVVQTSGCDSGSTNVHNTFLFQGTGVASAGTYVASTNCPNAAGTLGSLTLSRPWVASGAESTSVGYGAGTPLEQGAAISIIVDGSVGSYLVDGASVGTAGNIGTGGSSAITSIGFFVNGGGVNSNGGSNDYYLKGDVLEVIAFPSALTSNHTIIECYLSAKYNLGLSGC